MAQQQRASEIDLSDIPDANPEIDLSDIPDAGSERFTPPDESPSIWGQMWDKANTSIFGFQPNTMEEWTDPNRSAASLIGNEVLAQGSTPLGILLEAAGGAGIFQGLKRLRGLGKADEILSIAPERQVIDAINTPPQGLDPNLNQGAGTQTGLKPKPRLRANLGGGFTNLDTGEMLDANMRSLQVMPTPGQVPTINLTPEQILQRARTEAAKLPRFVHQGEITPSGTPSRIPTDPKELVIDILAESVRRNVKGEMTFDTIEEVIENIKNRTDWTQSFKEQKISEIMAREVKANGELPNNPGWIGQANSFSKTLLTMDMPFFSSAALRQGLPLWRTKAFWGSLNDMISSYGSQKAFELQRQGILKRALFANKLDETGMAIPSVAKRAKLDLPGITTGKSDRFTNNWLAKQPLFRNNERAFESFITQLRADYFEQLYNSAKAAGKNVDDPKFLEDLGHTVNSFTGSGRISDLPATQKRLNDWFFSAKFTKSRFDIINPMSYLDTKIDPMIRKERLKNLLSLGAASITMNGLYSLAGGEVGFNPLESDFMKSQFGDSRVDTNAGAQQPIVLAANLIYELARGGNAILEGQPIRPGFGEYGADKRIANFVMNRLNPVQSFVLGMLTHQSRSNPTKPFVWTEEVANMITPIIAQDIYDIISENADMSPILIPSAMAGFGVTTYGR